MKQLKLGLIVVCISMILACNDSSHPNQTTKAPPSSQNSIRKANTPIISINGKKVFVTNLNENSLLTSIQPNSTFDSIKYGKTDCQNSFCRLNNSKMYKLSKSGKFLLEYNPLTEETTLINESGERICTTKIKANNPEFSIETSPLEDEPGLIYIDVSNGISKYLPSGKQMKLNWEIKWGHDYYMHSCQIAKKKLIVFQRNYDDKIAGIDTYSLSTGNLIKREKIDDSVFATKYIYHENLLLKYGKNNLIIYDLNKDNAAYKISVNGNVKLIDATRNSGNIMGVLNDSNGLLRFSIKNKKIITSRFTFDNRFSFGKLIAIKDLFAIYYYQTNKPGFYSNNTKILNQGIMFFNNSTSHLFNMEHPSVTDYLRMHVMDSAIYINAEGRTYQIDLSKFL